MRKRLRETSDGITRIYMNRLMRKDCYFLDTIILYTTSSCINFKLCNMISHCCDQTLKLMFQLLSLSKRGIIVLIIHLNLYIKKLKFNHAKVYNNNCYEQYMLHWYIPLRTCRIDSLIIVYSLSTSCQTINNNDIIM